MLTFRNVSHYYGLRTPLETAALLGISFQLPSSSILLVNGHVGSGKTSLVLLAAHLTRPTMGKVVVADSARSAVVFQVTEQQFFCETVKEEVQYGPRNFGIPHPDRAYDEAMDSVGLPAESFADRSPFKLSGGEKRKVALACALALSPDILILDEPETSLDDFALNNLRTLLKRLSKSISLILTTHWPELYLDFATHLLLLDKGRQAFFGTMEDFLRLDQRDPARQVFPESELIEKARKIFLRSGRVPESIEELALGEEDRRRC